VKRQKPDSMGTVTKVNEPERPFWRPARDHWPGLNHPAFAWTARAGLTAPAIFVIFCLTLAPWLYDFPLNDDWAYAIGVKNLLEQGRIVLCDWAAATQLTHLLGGALFARLFGFSFTVLAAYTITAAAGTIFVFVKILEELEIRPFDRTLAALVLALNPIFLVLANSFMTDITYLFWMVLSSYFYIRHLKTARPAALVCAGLCAAAAYLTRQLGIALPLAYTLILAREKRLNLKGTIMIWLAPLAAIAGYALWLKYVHGPLWASYAFPATLKYVTSPGLFASNTVYRLFAVMLETGLVLFPLAAGACCFRGPAADKVRAHKKRGGTSAVGAPSTGGPWNGWAWLSLAVLAGFIFMNGPLPYLENTLNRTGLGVLTLGGAGFKPSSFFSNRYFWYALTALSAFASAMLLYASGLSLKKGDAAVRFVFLSAVIHLGISLTNTKFFDRYLLTLLPWFILAAVFAAKDRKFSRPAAVLALALMAAVSWAGVKDYLQWNRAKWDLALKPGHGLAPGEIVNGFDYEAWFNYEKNIAYLKTMKPLKLIDEWDWQRMTPYKAMISFGRRADLDTMDEQEYDTPLSSRKGVVYLLRGKEKR